MNDQQEREALPPLPEPEELGMDFDKGWDGVKAYGYTADQMHAYARAALAANAMLDVLGFDVEWATPAQAQQAEATPMTERQIAVALGWRSDCGPHRSEVEDARCIERACAEAWGVKLASTGGKP